MSPHFGTILARGIIASFCIIFLVRLFVFKIMTTNTKASSRAAPAPAAATMRPVDAALVAELVTSLPAPVGSV